MDILLELSRALEQRNPKLFEDALKRKANPNEPDNYGITIYEKALATAGCGEFITLCLRYGCKPDYLNAKNKAAINFACDSRDSENLRILLGSGKVQVDNKYNDLTPLNSLAKNLNENNANEVQKCIRMLLEHGASPNIEDDSEMTPLDYLENNNRIETSKRQEIIDLIKEHSNPNQTQNPPIKVISLAVLGHIEEFKRLLNYYKGDRLDLLINCITSGSHEAFDYMLDNDFDINEKSREGKTCVEIAVIYGNWYILSKLLLHKKFKLPKSSDLLHHTVGRLGEHPQKTFQDYVKCFHLLLDSKHIDVNARDGSERTALHYAIIFNHEFAVMELLRHGAYLGVTSIFNELVIEHINPELVEEHLDDCIRSEGSSRADKKLMISLNYKNLKLPIDMKSFEMDPICALANSKNLRHLLEHPLITTLISFKWHNISTFFYTFVGLSILLSIVFMVNICLCFTENVNPTLGSIVQRLSWISIICFVTFEIICTILTRLLWPLSRILNGVVIIFLVISNLVSSPESDQYFSRAIAAFAILLIAVNLTRIIGMLPVYSLSIYVLMLREVCYTFMRCCIPYSILVVSFGLSFYVLDLHNLSKAPVVNSVFKTVIMSTGEFNENEIEFKNIFFDRLFFLIFVVLISIVLMNLLSALAFSDTQAIHAAARVHSLRCLVNLLGVYEICFKNSGKLSQLLRKMRVHEVNLPETILVFPNDKHVQNVPKKSCEELPLHDGKNNQFKIAMPEDSFIMKITSSNIKRFFQVIDKKFKSDINLQLKTSMATKLENIERMLAEMQMKCRP